MTSIRKAQASQTLNIIADVSDKRKYDVQFYAGDQVFLSSDEKMDLGAQ